jgi:mannose-6-phosphate isomerase-like protein (cupin superfamily)
MGDVKVVRLEEDAVELPLAPGGGRVRALLRPEISRERSLLYVELPAACASADLRHPHEAVYYVARGNGQVVDTDTGTAHQVRDGLMVYLTPGQGYRLVGPAIFIGGPCPPDPTLFDRRNEEERRS